MSHDTVTAELARAVRRMSDRHLADIARALDDKSLVTLAYAMSTMDGPVHRPRPASTKVAKTDTKVPRHPAAVAADRNARCAPNGSMARVLAAVRAQPGTSRRELERVVGITTKTGMTKALHKLMRNGDIRREGCNSDSRYFPTFELVVGE